MRDQSDSPAVRFPPPFLYIAGFLLGLVLQRLMPISWPQASEKPVGFLLIAAGLALSSSAIALFFRKGTAIRPDKPSGTLVIAGPYFVTRNPMYLGLALVYSGLAVLMRTLFPLLLLPLVLFSVWYFCIRREEAYLERRFGTEYERYKSTVGRWFVWF